MAQGSSGGALVASSLILAGAIVGAAWLLSGTIERGVVELASLREAVEGSSPEAAAPPPAQARSRRPDPNRVYQVALGDAPTKGVASAPITIVEWVDFQ